MRFPTPILFAFPVLLGLGACTEDRSVSPTSPEEECLTRPAATDGRPIEGQYIVVYKTAAGGNPATPGARAGERTTALLERYGIGRQTLLSTFAGRTQGFCGKLSPAQAAKLAADPTVEAVEPDRIVSLAACFTVVDTRRITWGVRRVGYGSGKTAWIIDSGIDLDHPDLNVDAARSRTFIRGGTSADAIASW
jgi:hypothetical protein